MRNWHITWFLNKHLSWVLKRTVSPFRWDGSFEHPKQMFELESHSKDSLKVSASCRSSKSSRVDVNWEVHHMSVDLQCFFLNACWCCADPEGVQLWQCFIIIIFLFVFLVWGKDSNTTISGPSMTKHWMLCSFVIYRGSGPVLLRNPIFCNFPGGGSGSPVPHNPPHLDPRMLVVFVAKIALDVRFSQTMVVIMFVWM